jgi:large subunit ribosomal protein L30e
MVDVNKAILMATRTGKVIYGFKQTLDTVRNGKAKMVILASNCPSAMRRELERCANIAAIPIYQYGKSSVDLGVACGKSFVIAAMAIREPGDSEILKLVEEKVVK